MSSRDEERYIEYCLEHLGTSSSHLQQQIADLHREISEVEAQIKIETGSFLSKRIRRRLGKNTTELTRLQGRLAHAQAERAALDLGNDMYRDQWRRICAVPRVEDVAMKGNSLVVSTHPLFGKSNTSQWHRIGPFVITILLSGDRHQMHWINLEGSMQNLQAPAGVQYTGAVGCIGNAESVLQAAFKKQDHVALVEIAVRYAECSGQNDNIRHWPQVAPDKVPSWYIETFGR